MLHAVELLIDRSLVRALVDRALPRYAALSLTPLLSSGSSNALFRLGDDLLVRLPRQPGGSAAIDKEARWTPLIASALPVAVPEIVGVGEPDFGYPERWSVVRWLEGEVPGRGPGHPRPGLPRRCRLGAAGSSRARGVPARGRRRRRDLAARTGLGTRARGDDVSVLLAHDARSVHRRLAMARAVLADAAQ